MNGASRTTFVGAELTLRLQDYQKTTGICFHEFGVLYLGKELRISDDMFKRYVHEHASLLIYAWCEWECTWRERMKRGEQTVPRLALEDLELEVLAHTDTQVHARFIEWAKKVFVRHFTRDERACTDYVADLPDLSAPQCDREKAEIGSCTALPSWEHMFYVSNITRASI